MTGGLPWPYEVREASDEDKWSVNFAAAQNDEPVKCPEESGKAECWPVGVNIGVPIACCMVFFIVLAILYATYKPKGKPPSSRRNSHGHSPPTASLDVTNLPNKNNAYYQNSGMSTNSLAMSTPAVSQVDVSLSVEMDPRLNTRL